MITDQLMHALGMAAIRRANMPSDARLRAHEKAVKAYEAKKKREADARLRAHEAREAKKKREAR